MFYIGQKVVCIIDSNQYDLCNVAHPCVIKGKIYTIRGFRKATGGLYLEGIHLEDVSPGVERGFLRSRFRAIDNTYAEEVLKNVTEKIKEEEMETV